MSEKTDIIASIVLGVIILLVCAVIAYHTIGMIDDHNCWLDDYRAPHCRKYIEGE